MTCGDRGSRSRRPRRRARRPRVSGSTIRSSTPGPATPHERRRWRFGPSRSWSSGARLTTAPVVSVSPYACQNWQPNVRDAAGQHLLADRRGAVDDDVSSDEKSASSTPGTISMNCRTAGTRKRVGDALGRDQLHERRRVEVAHDDAASRPRTSRPRPSRRRRCGTAAWRRGSRRRPRAPHVDGHRQQGEEVVVGEHHALRPARSCRSSRAGRRRRRARSACAGRPARARRPTRRSPGTCSWPPITRIVPTVVRASAMASRIGTKSGPTTNTLAWASLTMNSTSGAARRQLTSTHTALASAAPKNTSKCSMPFLSRNATRSCGPTPAAPSPAATRLARSYSSAQVWRAVAQHEGRAVGLVGGVLAQDVGEVLDPHAGTIPPCDHRLSRPACGSCRR